MVRLVPYKHEVNGLKVDNCQAYNDFRLCTEPIQSGSTSVYRWHCMDNWIGWSAYKTHTDFNIRATVCWFLVIWMFDLMRERSEKVHRLPGFNTMSINQVQVDYCFSGSTTAYTGRTTCELFNIQVLRLCWSVANDHDFSLEWGWKVILFGGCSDDSLWLQHGCHSVQNHSLSGATDGDLFSNKDVVHVF